MKHDKDWTDVMRSALRDAEVIPPADGWARLEHKLGPQAPAPRVSLLRSRLLRVTAAAAVILALIVSGDLIFRSRVDPRQGENSDFQSVAIAERSSAPEFPQPETSNDSKENDSAEKLLLASAAPVRPVVAAIAGAEATVLRLEASSERVADAASVSENMPDTSVSESEEVKSGENSGSVRTAVAAEQKHRTTTRAAFAQPYDANAARSQAGLGRVRRPASLALYGGGGVSGSKRGMGLVSRQMANAAPAIEELSYTILPQPDYLESSFRHHQPFGFGLSVRKDLGRGFSVESGVAYTLLISDVRLPFASEDVTQKLHFIGVPVRVNWNFLQRKRFFLYIGAGGMVEKCVSAKFGEKSSDEPGVQWSVLGAAGAEYRLGGRVGLYFEPEVSYYFDQTILRTSRTDSPASFTLRLGLRVSF